MYIKNIEPTNENIFDEHEEEEYEYFDSFYHLHKTFIQPLNIKIDIPLFEEEIKQYHKFFRSWDINRPHLPRYGISLVNNNGLIRQKVDLGCSVFDQRNKKLPKNKHLNERLFTKKTEVYKNLKSLRPLDVLSDHLLRSNILLWHKDASFLPHLDTVPRSHSYLRIWGVNNPSIYKFHSADGDCMINVEPGRLYLIDTTKFHYAKTTGNWLYTFFIALDNSQKAMDKIQDVLQIN